MILDRDNFINTATGKKYFYPRFYKTVVDGIDCYFSEDTNKQIIDRETGDILDKLPDYHQYIPDLKTGNFNCTNIDCTKKSYAPISMMVDADDKGDVEKQPCPFCGHKYLKLCGWAGPAIHGSEAGRMANMQNYMIKRQKDHLDHPDTKAQMSHNEEVEMNNLGFSKKK